MDSSYNNSGIIASGPDEPVAPVNNIVVDGGGGPRHSRRGLLIAGIALIGVALVAGIIALIVMTGNIGNNSTKSSDVINVPSFNRLINYVVNGEESDAVLNGSYTANGDYYLLGQEGDEKVEVYKKTGELLEDFVSDYMTNYTEGQEENEHRKRITVLVDSTEDLFGFVNVMEFTDKIYGYQIREMGRENALAYYKFTGLKDNSYVADFTELYTEWVEALFSDPDAVSDAYRRVLPYYDMSGDFVASLFSINGLMKDKTMAGEIDE